MVQCLKSSGKWLYVLSKLHDLDPALEMFAMQISNKEKIPKSCSEQAKKVHGVSYEEMMGISAGSRMS